MARMKVFVVVLGDVSRSPRMQYHALSLATEGYSVTVIGDAAGQPLLKLQQHPNVTFQYLSHCPDFKKYVSSTVGYVLKALYLWWLLFCALVRSGRPDAILVQNPPAVPALVSCWLYARLCRSYFLIDWHNYAHTILALSLPNTHTLVRLYKGLEFHFGERSDGNLCVTNAMMQDLKARGIHAVPLHDCPAEHFRPLQVSEKHELLLRLGAELPEVVQDSGDNETVLTRRVGGVTSLRDDRPGLLISSTSWTEDEDFSLLIDALSDYELAKLERKGVVQLPRLLVIITGSGPLKDFYKALIQRKKWQHVQVVTPWLTAEDYPKLIACGDLGVSLHKSSSGLDLPMKVVDMFGCGLPVAAVSFQCLGELVEDKVHGTVFRTARELGEQLIEWFDKFPAPPRQKWRQRVHNNIEIKMARRWHENWVKKAKPLFESLKNKSQ